ncbi:MAG: hypothetical protein LUI14_08615 [Lachnospiraceae bacterium]|nr:hypothetical protein [Lachnospiraceae bacterium]
MKKVSYKKIRRMILAAWIILAIVLIIGIAVISQENNSVLQEHMTKIVLGYVFGSAVLSGIVHLLKKKEYAE